MYKFRTVIPPISVIFQLRKLIIGLIVPLGFTGIPGLTIAQAQTAGAIEEIVVSAQRRDENLQDVPITVNVFSSKDINDLAINNARDLVGHTPSLAFMSTSSNLTAPSIYLRGLGNESFHANAGSPVGVYVDGSYVGNNTAYGFQLMDVDRVEVLKGPQGTLYGRNTTAGLINYIPRKPVIEDGLSGNVSAGYGRFDTWNIQGAVNMPLSDSAALRVAVKSDHTNGQFENVSPTFNTDDYGGHDATSVRGTLLFQPSDRLRVLASGFYGDLDGPPGIGVALGVLDPTTAPVSFATRLALVPCRESIAVGSNCSDVAGFVPNGDIYVSEKDSPGGEDAQSYGFRLQLDYDFETFTFTSISTYDNTEREVFNDTDNLPSGLLVASLASDYESFSQELRLTSSHGGPFSWIAGFYYYTDDVIQWEGVAVPYIDSLFGFGYVGRDLEQETSTYAFFGDVAYEFSDRLELTAGLRVTNDERKGDQFRFNIDSALIARNSFLNRADGMANNVRVLFPVTHLENDWTEVSGRVSLTYRWSDEVSTYVTGARGFKGGEINGAPGNADNISLSGPEFLTSVEVGIKAELWDRRTRLNLSGFYYDFTDQQVFVEEPTATGSTSQVISNAGSSTIYGVEAQAVIVPAENLRLNLTAAYMEAEFDEFLIDPHDLDNDGDLKDKSGNKLANAPELFLSALARYDIPLAHGGKVTLQADANLQDDRFFTVDNNPFLAQDSYWLVGARVTYLPPGENWDLSFWGKNLTDEEYFVGGFDFRGLAGSIYPLSVGERMTWGVTGNYRF